MLTHSSAEQGLTIASITVIPLTMNGLLPPAAAMLTIIWMGLQIWTWVINKGWKKLPDRETLTSRETRYLQNRDRD